MQKDTLRKVLSAFVDDFGYQTVRETLEDCVAETGRASKTKQSSPNGYSKPRLRRSATDFVEALEIVDKEKKDTLLILAEKYEKKTFMPNINNVRAFLTQQGQDASGIKSRQQAILAVFKHLADWETQRLCEFDKRGLYGGPKSLSVIAKSIENAGWQNRLRKVKDGLRSEQALSGPA